MEEILTPLQIAASVAIFAGVFLVVTKTGFKINRRLISAIYANILWAVYWIVLTYGIRASTSAVLPVLLARISAFIVVFAYSFTTGKLIEKKPNKKQTSSSFYPLLALVLIGGLADAGTNLSFGFAVFFGLVAIGSVITATTPVFIAILGRIFFKDKLTKPQVIGILLAILGAVAIAI